MNFSNFKPVQTSNTREHVNYTKGQNFKFKFKKFISKKGGETNEESLFTISNEYFDKFGLQERGLLEVVNEGVSYLAVVDSDNATMLKNRAASKPKDGEAPKEITKGKKFKSTVFEKALEAQGVISLDKVGVNQKLDLKLVEGSENVALGEGEKAIQTYGIYEIVKVDGQDDTDEDEDETEDTTANTVSPAEPSASVSEAPAPTPVEAPVAQPQASNDDF